MNRLFVCIIVLAWSCAPLAAQDTVLSQFKTSAETELRGRIILYDWFSHEHTSDDAFVVKTTDTKLPYVRVLYRVYWGFDAPAAKETDVLDRWAFIGRGTMWSFFIHNPQEIEEKQACAFHINAYKYEDETGSGEIPRFIPTPGAGTAGIPPIESLPCFILRRGGLTRVDAPDIKH